MAVLTYNGNIIGKSSANDGILTIQKNGNTVATFSANSSSNIIADISVPTKLSDLTDDVVSGNYVKLNSNISQTVYAPNTVPLYLKGNTYNGTYPIRLRFEDENGTLLGGLGVDNNHKVSLYDGANSKELAFSGDVVSKSGDTMSGGLIISENLSNKPPLVINNTNTSGTFTWLNFQNNGVSKGFLGVNTSPTIFPIFCEAGQNPKEIALKEDVILTSSDIYQTITRNQSGAEIPLAVKSGDVNTGIRFFNSAGTLLGDLGINSAGKPYYNNGTKYEIALVNNTLARPAVYSIASGASQTITLVQNTIYLLMNTSNVSKIMRFIATTGYGFSISDLMTLQGFTITNSDLSITVQNNTSYALSVLLLVLS